VFARSRGLLLLGALLGAVALTSSISSYDFFWHLSTGRWIVEHRALPITDPFTVGSEQIRWINGEWLFQLLQWFVWKVDAETSTILARGTLAFAGLLSLSWFALRKSVDPAVALALLMLGLYGAEHRLGYRPEGAATLLAIAFAIASFSQMRSLRRSLFLAVLAILWINTHPSALLAPFIFGASWISRLMRGERDRLDGMTVIVIPAALAFNPYGVAGVLAPLSLARLASGGSFVNTEWLPTSPTVFPIVYAAVGFGALVMLRRRDTWRAHAGEIVLFLCLSALAIRYVRNHGFFFAMLPVVLAPFLPPVRERLRPVLIAAGLILAGVVAVTPPEISFAIDREKFPVSSVQRLERSGLRGNIYNPDQLGGFLIHHFHGERRVLIDGRNELHRSLIARLQRGRRDSRIWDEIFREYGLTIAVEDYSAAAIDVVDPVTRRSTTVPASLAYFPRDRWALIAFDDVAMIFAKRSAHPEPVIRRLEYRLLIPDAPAALAGLDEPRRRLARAEVERAEREVGVSRISAAMREALVSR
jgi:hypothetical protein